MHPRCGSSIPLFDCTQGGAAGTNFHGGSDGDRYAPIADLYGTVIEARPGYYGILFFTLAGQGTLLATQLSVGSLNATAYASAGGINLVESESPTQRPTPPDRQLFLR
jgi:hypothetical protein